jgi:hypothetical protein
MVRSVRFPPNCPPREAEAASGEVYRLVDSNPLAAKDFRSWYELKPERIYENQAKECQARGLSVYTQKSSVLSLFNRIPTLRKRKKKVALGKLTPDLGVMLNTPSSEDDLHHTLWVAIGKEPWTVFQVVDIDK